MKNIIFAAIILLTAILAIAEDLEKVTWDPDNVEYVTLMLERPAYGNSMELLIKFKKPVSDIEGLIFRYRHGELNIPLDYSNICEQIRKGLITSALVEKVGSDRFTGIPKVEKLKNIRGFIYK